MPKLVLEVGKTYTDSNGQDVQIEKVIPFNWSDGVSKESAVQTMFYLGDNATLYTVTGQGLPRHSLDQSFAAVDDLIIEVGAPIKNLPPSGGGSWPTTGGHIGFPDILTLKDLDAAQIIAELKARLGAAGLNLSVTVT